MKNSRYIFLSLLLIVNYLLTACGAMLPAGAQTKKNGDGSMQVEFAGKVEAINGSQWTVDGQTFDISDPSLVNGTFKVGDSVHINATVNPDGSIKIERVEAYQAFAQQQGSPKPVETQVAPATVNSGSSNVMPTPVAIATTSASLPIVQGKDDPAVLGGSQQEVIGTVSAINGSQWVIGGQTFTVTNATEFKNSPGVGDLVKVHVILNPDGTFTMTEIELSPVDATSVPNTGTYNLPGQGSNDDHGKDGSSHDENDDNGNHD